MRATARKASSPSVAHLLPLAEALPGKLEIHEADLTVEGSFDKVLEGAYYLYASIQATLMHTDAFRISECFVSLQM